MKKKTLIFSILALCLFTNCENDDNVITYTENLIAYYPFNGNAFDEINLNDGIVKGAKLTSSSDAYLFDGIDNVIEISHDESFNFERDFTISALFNTNEIKSQQIIRKGKQVNGEFSSPYSLSLSQTNDIIFSISTEKGNTFSQLRKKGYETNKWYLITGVFKENVMYLYVNGKLEAFNKINGEITLNYDSLLIGSRLSLSSDTFNGVIDDVRFYNSALTESEIKNLYKN
jgi:hypothetical protein